MAAFEFLLLLI